METLEEIFKRKFTKNNRYSIFEIHSDLFEIRCTIRNNLSTRNRRQMLLTFYRLILPHLNFVYGARIHHEGQVWSMNDPRWVELSTSQGIDLSLENHQIGYLIRGLRTKQGLTQKQFAEKLSINSTYLSKLEKGHYLPSIALFQKIKLMNQQLLSQAR